MSIEQEKCDCCGGWIDEASGQYEVIDGEDICLDCMFLYHSEYAREIGALDGDDDDEEEDACAD